MNYLLLMFAFLVTLSGVTQNLVPNHSFEQHSECPQSRGAIKNAVPWERVNNNTTDYYHPCGIPTLWSAPDNNFGFQYAAHGEAYVGLRVYDTEWGPNYREYAGVKLISPLKSCKRYQLSFKVSFAYENQTKWATDDIAATIVSYPGPNSNTPTATLLTYQPVVENTQGNIIKDSLGWTLITGEFIATGGEEFLIIGNFKDDANTTAVNVYPQKYNGTSYYYLDEVILLEIEDPVVDMGNDTTICDAYPLNVSIPGDWDQITWGDGTLGANNTIDTAGMYWVEAELSGCIFMDSLVVTMDTAPNLTLPVDTTICSGSIVEIEPTSDFPFFWKHNNSNGSAILGDSGNYVVVSQNGVCVIEERIEIKLDECVFVPQAFSPNGDGINDVLYVRGAFGREIVFEVFDRWGQSIFRSTDQSIGWDGTIKGQRAMSGTYAYMVILRDDSYNELVISGDVTLIR